MKTGTNNARAASREEGGLGGDVEAGLEALKARMSESQRQQMAEIISNELKRREEMKRGTEQVQLKTKSRVNSGSISGGVSHEHLDAVYGDIDNSVRKMRLKKVEEKLSQLRKHKSGRAAALRSASSAGLTMPSIPLGKGLMVFVLVALAGAKILLSDNEVDATTGAQKISAQSAPAESIQSVVAPQPVAPPPAPVTKSEVQAPQEVAASQQPIGGGTPTEHQLLTELDTRRVELEKRKNLLDRREAEIASEGKAVNEKLAELKGLVARLAEVRTEKDRATEARMEQLANVYGGMDPKEAAPLIARLDDSIALAILERLPGKRMGQILAGMEKDRAIDLTRLLTDKKN